MPTPTRDIDTEITSIVAASPSDAWAIAAGFHLSERPTRSWRVFVIHWDGHRWQDVVSPNWGENLAPGALPILARDGTPLLLANCIHHGSTSPARLITMQAAIGSPSLCRTPA